MGHMAQFSLSNVGIGQGYSNVDTNIQTTGGQAIRYYLSVRYVTKFVSSIKEQIEDDVTGEIIDSRVANKFRLICIKNKINDKVYQQCDFVIRFGDGTDDFPIIYDVLSKNGIIYNKSSFMIYKTTNGEEIKVLGKTNFQKELKEKYFDDMIKQFGEIEKNGDSMQEEIEL